MEFPRRNIASYKGRKRGRLGPKLVANNKKNIYEAVRVTEGKAGDIGTMLEKKKKRRGWSILTSVRTQAAQTNNEKSGGNDN